MNIGSYDFDIEGARSKLEDIGAKKILLQLPDGLRHRSEDFRRKFDQEVRLWGGSCYGACDLPSDIGDCDALVHIGHARIPNLDIDYEVIYLPGKSTRFVEVPQELFDKLKGKVALYATAQHLHQLEDMSKIISEKGHKTVIGEGDDRIESKGQVLGCDYSSAVKDADTHVYLGTGRFHPLGLSFALETDVLMYNPSTGDISMIDEKERDRFLRKRFAAISLIKDASKIGIIVSKKTGQNRMKTAEELLELGEKLGKEMMIIELDEIDKRSIDDFDVEGIINTACPRIALDDAENYDTLLLTPEEFEIAIGKKEWDDWEADQLD